MNEGMVARTKMNVGIIGCGYWGPNIIRNVTSLKNAQMAMCCDTKEERLHHIKGLYPFVQTTKDYQEILKNSEIDAVIIATPVSTHYRFAREALDHKKHVLVEKPLAATTKECEELIACSKKNMRILMVDHTFEYSPAVHTIKEMIERGELGHIYTITMSRLNLGLFQPDINVIWDLAPHDISILLYLLNQMPLSVIAAGEAHINPRIEDDAYCILKFPNKALAHIHVSWLDPCKIRRVTIVGSERMVVYDDVEPTEKIKVYDKGVTINNLEQVKQPYYDTFAEFQYMYRHGDVCIPKLENREPLKSVCQHFIECSMHNKEPQSNGVVGLKVVTVMEALQQSLKNKSREVIV